jgi:hypothetical protein
LPASAAHAALLGPDVELADATALEHRLAALVDAIRTRAA